MADKQRDEDGRGPMGFGGMVRPPAENGPGGSGAPDEPVAGSVPISVEWLQPKDITELTAPHRANRSFALVVHTSLPVKSTDANLGNWSFVKGFYIWLGEDGHLNLHPVPDDREEAKARYRAQSSTGNECPD